MRPGQEAPDDGDKGGGDDLQAEASMRPGQEAPDDRIPKPAAPEQ